MVVRDKEIFGLRTSRFQYKLFDVQLTLIAIALAYFATVDDSSVGSDDSDKEVFLHLIFVSEDIFEIIYCASTVQQERFVAVFLKVVSLDYIRHTSEEETSRISHIGYAHKHLYRRIEYVL